MFPSLFFSPPSPHSFSYIVIPFFFFTLCFLSFSNLSHFSVLLSSCFLYLASFLKFLSKTLFSIFFLFLFFFYLASFAFCSVNKQYRMEGVPESGIIEERSSSHNQPSLYKSFQTERAKKSPSEGRTRIF